VLDSITASLASLHEECVLQVQQLAASTKEAEIELSRQSVLLDTMHGVLSQEQFQGDTVKARVHAMSGDDIPEETLATLHAELNYFGQLRSDLIHVSRESQEQLNKHMSLAGLLRRWQIIRLTPGQSSASSPPISGADIKCDFAKSL